MPIPPFTILRSNCSYGSIGTDGWLGYDTILASSVLDPAGRADASYISAHAPSLVEIELTASAKISGLLNLTASHDPLRPVAFMVNENPLGLVGSPGQSTAALTLAKGRHVLRTWCENADSRHSVWRLDPCPQEAAPRLALTTIACYPSKESWKVLWHLSQSAIKQDRWLHVMGVGTGYHNHTAAKIVRFRKFVEQIKAEYILFTDGKDSFLVGNAAEILAEFAQFGHDFVTSMERGCWPAHDAAWRDAFPSNAEGRNWPNSGGWMGTKAGVLRVLDECWEYSQQIQGTGLVGAFAPWQSALREYAWDDQALMQLCFLAGSIKGDYDCRIFTNVGTADRRLEGNEHYEFRAGRVVVRASGATPAVIHFSGSACWDCRDQWAARLGVVGA